MTISIRVYLRKSVANFIFWDTPVKQKNKRFNWAGGLTPVRSSGTTEQAQRYL